MDKLNVNTVTINEDAQKLLKLVSEYDKLVETFYLEFKQNLSKSWQGESANNYIRSLKADEESLKNVSKLIKLYGNELLVVSNAFDKEIKKWKNLDV